MEECGVSLHKTIVILGNRPCQYLIHEKVTIVHFFCILLRARSLSPGRRSWSSEMSSGPLAAGYPGKQLVCNHALSEIQGSLQGRGAEGGLLPEADTTSIWEHRV